MALAKWLTMVLREDRSVLEAALVGILPSSQPLPPQLLASRSGWEEAGWVAAAPVEATPQRKKHRISPEGRARIAAVQRKRWAAAKEARLAGSPAEVD